MRVDHINRLAHKLLMHYSRGGCFGDLLREAADEYRRRNDNALSVSFIMSRISKECKRIKRARDRHREAVLRKRMEEKLTNPYVQLQLF